MKYSEEDIKSLEHGGFNSDDLTPNVKAVDIICCDCQLPFKWALGTLRCKECRRLNINRKRLERYTHKTVNHLKTPVTWVDEYDKIHNFKSLREYRDYLRLSNPDLKSIKLSTYSFKNKTVVKSYGGWLMKASVKDPLEAIQKIKDSWKGRGKGITKPNRKLTHEQVLAILKDNRIYKEIANDYNVSRSLIGGIKQGRYYTDITGAGYNRKYLINWK